MHRNWIMILAAVVCATGCMSTSHTSNLESSGSGLAANGTPPGPSAPHSTKADPTKADGWATTWKNNPVAKWFSQRKSPADPPQQQQIPPKLDPISLGFSSDPSNPQFYVSMAEISDKGGNAQQARLLYQKASSLEPDNLPALVGLARLEDRQGRLDEAIQVYRKAITTHPRNTTVLNDLAICHARKNHLETSLDLLEQAVRLQPDKPLYRNNIAKVLTELNRSEEALVHLAVVHSPAVAHYNLGVLLAQRGRMEEATRYLAMAAGIDPGMQAARSLLDQLNRAAPSGPANQVQLAARPSTANPEPQTLSASISELPIGDAPLLLPPVN